MPELPTGMVTFLFAHSTGPAVAATAAILRRQAEITDGLAAAGGVLLVGQGAVVGAVFHDAGAALRAALTLRLAQPLDDPLPLRAFALHTAVVAAAAELEQQSAPALHLLAAAAAGQILLTDAAVTAILPLLPAAVGLRDLGAWWLQSDLAPTQVFACTTMELAGSPPAAPAPPSRPLDLSEPTTPLIGREHEVATALAALRSGGVRLLTLTGPGGAGKTHLALHLAGLLRDRFPHGVGFVNLNSVTDLAGLVVALAGALRVAESAEEPLWTTLQTRLRAAACLLVLDNFELAVPAAPLLTDLLAAAPSLYLIVTSRTVLHLAGEQELPVPPLALPDLQHLPPPKRLREYAAVRLFVERARLARPGFALSDDNAAAVAALCVRLDGLPLALELAAARSNAFPPAQLLARLSEERATQHWPAGAAPPRPARHQTLHDAMEWSYRLLPPAAQTLFVHLAVFVGGCSAAAAAAVVGDSRQSAVAGQQSPVGGDPAGVDQELGAAEAADIELRTQNSELRTHVSTGLEVLLDHSLLRQSEGVDGAPRFGMLDTIHEYAAERLVADRHAPALRRRHAAYYRALAAQAEPELRGAQQVRWLERLEEEQDNLRAALAWTLAAGGGEDAVQMAAALWRFWYAHGHLSEGRRWLDSALTRPITPAARAKGLRVAGALAGQQGDYAQAEALLQESLALFRSLADAWNIANTLNSLGLLATDQADYVRAESYYEASLADRRALGDTAGIAISLNNCGIVARYQGHYAAAMQAFRESLILRQQLGDSWGLANTLHNLAEVAQCQEDYEQARTLYRESLALLRDLGNRPLMVLCLEGVAEVAAHCDPPAQAARLFGAAEALREALGTPLRPMEQATYHQHVALAQARLDPSAWRAAWAAGRAMSPDHAVAFVLAGRITHLSSVLAALTSAPDVEPAQAKGQP